MYSWVINEIAGPLSRRVGTMAGSYLLTLGVSSETVNVVTAGLVAGIGVLVDLATSHAARKVRK